MSVFVPRNHWSNTIIKYNLRFSVIIFKLTLRPRVQMLNVLRSNTNTFHKTNEILPFEFVERRFENSARELNQPDWGGSTALRKRFIRHSTSFRLFRNSFYNIVVITRKPLGGKTTYWHDVYYCSSTIVFRYNVFCVRVFR